MPHPDKRLDILQCIRENPFISQRELADRFQISRSAVAAHISALMRDGEILGRAYVFPERRGVLCIGGANVDRKLQTRAPLVYGTSNPAEVVESHGGVARNVAENLARLGLPPALVTMVGDDKEGEALLAHVRGLGVDVGQTIQTSDARTGTYTAVLDADGNLAVALADMEIYDRFTVDRLAPKVRVMAQCAVTVVDTNLPSDSLAFVISAAAETGTHLVVAPVSSPKAKRLPERLDGVRTLIANRDELAAISGLPVVDEADLQQACTSLLRRGCATVVVTLGAEGVAWMDEAGTFQHLPVDRVQAVDVTGAGDAFVAGFAYAMLHSLRIRQACWFGAQLSRITLLTQETVATDITPKLAHTWLAESRSLD
ncbi:carbohydrate kinase [Alicyclobacillus contaminans]|uniref:carbohydrate kinase n=1 Tax=Alicyclobacillus contaminans TaxID=392016 RepID=UPI0004138989|nr:carbohydrate kinase [Alicyclobacillus contaminans]GMA49888.1 carbohydrate kinase [Alicyclobacillus contaminans]